MITKELRQSGAKASKIAALAQLHLPIPPSYGLPTSCYEDYLENRLDSATLLREFETLLQTHPRLILRSSAQSEDGQTQSFAGQFVSVMDIRTPQAALEAIMQIYQSNQKPIAYGQPVTSPMGILIQEMIVPTYSGVAFTHDPLSFAKTYLIEYTSGTYESGRFERHVFGYKDKPTDPMLAQIVALLGRMQKHDPAPLDVEWVYDGEKVWIVQARPMTGKKMDLYSNFFTKQFLPGQIKPLVYDVNVLTINRVWVSLLQQFTGVKDIDYAHLSNPFYSYVYFNMGYLGQIVSHVGFDDHLLEDIALGKKVSYHFSIKQAKLIPNMFAFVLQIRRRLKHLPSLLAQQELLWQENKIHLDQESSIEEQLQWLSAYIEKMQDITYLNIIYPIYSAIQIKRTMKKMEKKGWNEPFEPYMDAEKLHYDANRDAHLVTLGKMDVQTWSARYAHFSSNGNDMSMPSLKEDLQRLKAYLDQASAPPLTKPKPARFEKSLKRLEHYVQTKQNISFYYTRTYAAFREMLLKMGQEWQKQGYLQTVDDVFYLTMEQLHQPSNTWLSLVSEEKAREQAYANVSLKNTIYPDEAAFYVEKSDATMYQGIGVSSGVYENKVLQIHSLQEAHVIGEEIILIPYSDTSWMPLLSKAKAIIVESGGYLSHTAIIARELGIPCVILHDAHSLQSGDTIIMNGRSGEIRIISTAQNEST
ncbi:MAG: PEP/pyruvate-binding domain-containing protein [Erysipelotrichaceae bacterium]